MQLHTNRNLSRLNTQLRTLDANTPTTRPAAAQNPQWGKKWGKNHRREKTMSHKKIQSPLSDWIS
jgi:hypothetical protein